MICFCFYDTALNLFVFLVPMKEERSEWKCIQFMTLVYSFNFKQFPSNEIIAYGIDILPGMAAALLIPHCAALAHVLADGKAVSHFAELLDKKWPKNFCPQQFQQCRF